MTEQTQFPMRPGTERVALVLQGGGALGAYQVGVFQALDEHGFTPNWVAGTSIGAINGAIIAGNPPGRRFERVKRFWDTVALEDPVDVTRLPDALRQAYSFWSVLVSLISGRPRFFTPHAFRPFSAQDPHFGQTYDRASFYDSAPLRDLLLELVDFDYLNNGSMRFSVGVVHVATGRLRYFDNTFQRLGIDHVMASCALPPAFPPVEIEGELYWDGGIYSNTPLDVVLDDYPRVNTLCFMVDLWNANGVAPRSISQTLDREKDIRYASRSEQHIQDYLAMHNLRRAIRHLYRQLTPEQRADPELKRLASLGCHTTMDVVHLNNRDRPWELASKDADFSRSAIDERWRLGYADATRACRLAAWMQPVDRYTGVVVHEVPPEEEERPDQAGPSGGERNAA